MLLLIVGCVFSKRLLKESKQDLLDVQQNPVSDIQIRDEGVDENTVISPGSADSMRFPDHKQEGLEFQVRNQIQRLWRKRK